MKNETEMAYVAMGGAAAFGTGCLANNRRKSSRLFVRVFPIKDVPNGVSEAVNDAWPAHSPIPHELSESSSLRES